jgi:hypothetical protein
LAEVHRFEGEVAAACAAVPAEQNVLLADGTMSAAMRPTGCGQTERAMLAASARPPGELQAHPTLYVGRPRARQLLAAALLTVLPRDVGAEPPLRGPRVTADAEAPAALLLAGPVAWFAAAGAATALLLGAPLAYACPLKLLVPLQAAATAVAALGCRRGWCGRAAVRARAAMVADQPSRQRFTGLKAIETGISSRVDYGRAFCIGEPLETIAARWAAMTEHAEPLCGVHHLGEGALEAWSEAEEQAFAQLIRQESGREVDDTKDLARCAPPYDAESHYCRELIQRRATASGWRHPRRRSAGRNPRPSLLN